MAVRNKLHKNHLAEFSTWLITEGWEQEPPKGDYEVLRAKKEGVKLLIYERNTSEHLSYEGKHSGIINQFLNSRRHPNHE